MTKQTYHHSITKYLYEEFEKSAVAYLRNSLKMLHEARKPSGDNSQPAIGNLGITVELMLKTLIVKHNPSLLFTGLPDEIKIFFACPESLPKGFNWRPFDIDLRSFKYNTKELNECISLFYILLPEYKHELHSYFRLLACCRNASVHSVLPSFQRFELERLGFLTMRLYTILVETKNMYGFSYWLTKEDKKFLSEFKNERIERFKKKIEEAKEKSKHIDTSRASLSVDGWEDYVVECPMCGAEAILAGYTELSVGSAPDGYEPDFSLDFLADSFECQDCGLKLDDSEELKHAGMELHYDRSDELERWQEEHYQPYEEYS